MNPNKLNTSLEFIKGIGKIRSKLIRDELKQVIENKRQRLIQNQILKESEWPPCDNA